MYKNIVLPLISLMIGCSELPGAQNEDRGILVYLEKIEKGQASFRNMSLKLVFKNFSEHEKNIVRPNINHDFVFYIKDDQGLILAGSEIKESSAQHQKNNFLLFPKESLSIEFNLYDILPLEKLKGKFNLFFEFSTQSPYHNNNNDFLLFSPLDIELTSENEDSMISFIDAMRIAQENLPDIMKKSIENEATPPIVSYENKIFTVTFPYKTLQTRRGPDFLFRVTIDAKSGKILSNIAGG